MLSSVSVSRSYLLNDNGSLVEDLCVQRVHQDDLEMEHNRIASCELVQTLLRHQKSMRQVELIGVPTSSGVHLRRSSTVLTHWLEVNTCWPVHMYASRRIRSLARYNPDTVRGVRQGYMILHNVPRNLCQ